MRLPVETATALSRGAANASSHGNIHGPPHGSANAPFMETSTGLPMVRPMRLPVETATALSHGNGPVTSHGNGTGAVPCWITSLVPSLLAIYCLNTKAEHGRVKA